jgi:hypothetical protein
MRAFLFDDLRIDPDNVINFNLDIVQQYVAYGEKPRQMKALLTVLKETQA